MQHNFPKYRTYRLKKSSSTRGAGDVDGDTVHPSPHPAIPVHNPVHNPVTILNLMPTIVNLSTSRSRDRWPMKMKTFLLKPNPLTQTTKW